VAIQISFHEDGKKEQIHEQDVYIMSTIILTVLLGKNQLLMDRRLHQVEQVKVDLPPYLHQQQQRHSNQLHKMLMRLPEIISYQMAGK
jgi:hypothetical protein